MRRKKLHYAWIVMLGGLLTTAVGLGIFNSTFSVFVVPVTSELGLSRAAFTLHRTIITLVSAMLMPLYSRWFIRFGAKRLILISGIGLAAITMGYSFSTALWHFNLLAFFHGVLINGTNFMTIGMLIGGWFSDKKGFATGIAYCGSGIGGAILTPIVGQIIEVMDWQAAYRISGLIGFLIIVPVALFLIQNKPEDMGLIPYKENSSGDGVKPDVEGTISVNLTVSEAMRTPVFYLLALAFFLIAILAGGPHIHTMPFLSDIGYSPAYAASVVSFIMVLLTVGKILLGMIFDRLGTLLGCLFVGVCCMSYPLFAMFAAVPGMPFVYGLFYGMASSAFSVPVNVLITRYFGERDFPQIFGIYSMITTLGTAIAVPSMGMVYDVYGHYDLAWRILLIFAVIVLFALVSAFILSKRVRVEQELA